MNFNGVDLLLASLTKGRFILDDINLTGVKSIALGAGWQEALIVSCSFEVHRNAPDGPLLDSGTMPVPKPGTPGGMVMITLLGKGEAGSEPIYNTYTVENGKEPVQVAFLNATFN